MKGKIWLIGGTSESVAIASMLARNEILFVVSVTTPTAKDIYADHTRVEIGSMNRQTMQSFCQREQIQIIMDASHPYATEVSTLAIAISNLLNISYLRYERSNYQQQNSAKTTSLITEVDSFKAFLAGDYLQGEKVLLTVGCKALGLFQPYQSQATLYARVLPKVESLTMALKAGFKCDRIIAIRPPLNMALEMALWQQWKISLVVTKASGKAGGEDLKRQVAASLNIPLIVIARPKIIYPQQTDNLKEVLAFCQSNN